LHTFKHKEEEKKKHSSMQHCRKIIKNHKAFKNTRTFPSH